MQFNVTVRTDGLQHTRNRIKMIQNAPKEALNEIGESVVAKAQQRIRSTKTAPDGTPWAPWSMATIRANQNKGGSLLYRTGALLDSIQYRVSDKTITVYSNVGYARFLQFGTPKMPARPFLGWTQEDINKVKQIIGEALK